MNGQVIRADVAPRPQNQAMSLEQLTGRHARLQRELGLAYSTLPWHTGRIDRLARDLAATEREIAACLHLGIGGGGVVRDAEVAHAAVATPDYARSVLYSASSLPHARSASGWL